MVDFQWSASRGRHVTAKEALNAGLVVLEETPVAAISLRGRGVCDRFVAIVGCHYCVDGVISCLARLWSLEVVNIPDRVHRLYS